ncbi:hypothetical protein [Cellulosimicrobium sp. Marseille-Q4280]|uniref:hypothetical protein n=1 Tax=Cellulosimicrobium sp. Marseille-Q4280 TaxID=2937992 RepID=UPI00203C1899|nr:hypothetical protein [Cellulosimicrobium sp. Marseille-Q4280]
MDRTPQRGDSAWALGLTDGTEPVGQGRAAAPGEDPWALPPRPRVRRTTDTGPVAVVEQPPAPPVSALATSIVAAAVSASFATVAYAQSRRVENLKPRPQATWTRDVTPVERVDPLQARAVLEELAGL